MSIRRNSSCYFLYKSLRGYSHRVLEFTCILVQLAYSIHQGLLSDPKYIIKDSLSSPYLFKFVCHDIVELFSNTTCGIRKNNISYNVCFNGDEVLLCSITITGTQNIIDEANNFLTDTWPQHRIMPKPCMQYFMIDYGIWMVTLWMRTAILYSLVLFCSRFEEPFRNMYKRLV